VTDGLKSLGSSTPVGDDADDLRRDAAGTDLPGHGSPTGDIDRRRFGERSRSRKVFPDRALQERNAEPYGDLR